MRALSLLLSMLVAVTALAQSEPERVKARQLYQRARQHYNLGEFADALRDFKEAYRNYEEPSLLFNIGQCERQLDHKREAAAAYRAYLRNAGDVPNRKEVEDIIALLDKAIADESAARKQPSQEPLPMPATPAPTGTPTTPPAESATAVTASATPAPARTPVYKRWWLWTAVGVVAAGAAVGLGVGLTRTPAPPTANTDFGTFHY